MQGLKMLLDKLAKEQHINMKPVCGSQPQYRYAACCVVVQLVFQRSLLLEKCLNFKVLTARSPSCAQTTAADVAEDHVEEDFCVVHALKEPCGTALPDDGRAESLDEQLLIAVQACNKDDVKALLRQGATLHIG
eukprot:5640-Heterococcus_DN1.PRE.3